jgi:hypothetical protein
MVLCHIHCRPEHNNCEGYTRNPANQTNNCKDCDDNSGFPKVPVEVVDSSSDGTYTIQNTSNLHELLCKSSGCDEIQAGEYKATHRTKTNPIRVFVLGEVIAHVVMPPPEKE